MERARGGPQRSRRAVRCPTYDSDRAEFTSSIGLRVAETWWLIELGSAGGEAGVNVSLPGADAITVGAPPVYAPPGPMLFLPAPEDPSSAVPAALAKAPELGCAGVVVNQTPSDQDMAQILRAAGLRPHCDYFTGTIERERAIQPGRHLHLRASGRGMSVQSDRGMTVDSNARQGKMVT